MRLTMLSLSDGQRNFRRLPAGANYPARRIPDPVPARVLRWYAEDRPAWPAPMTTMSVLSATRNAGGHIEVGWNGLGVLTDLSVKA